MLTLTLLTLTLLTLTLLTLTLLTLVSSDSVRVFDLLSNGQVTSSRFNQGGTSVLWAPASVSLAVGHVTGGDRTGR